MRGPVLAGDRQEARQQRRAAAGLVGLARPRERGADLLGMGLEHVAEGLPRPDRDGLPSATS
jgi:hypothetical protein